MLFDIGWPELLLIGTVALVVIGPKDLPRALRTAGFWVRKARTLSREFQSSIDQMIREAELDEMRQELKKATDLNIEDEFKKAVDPTGELAESIKPPDIPDFFSESTPTPPLELTPEAVPASVPEASALPANEPELPLAESPDEEQLPLPFAGVPAEPPRATAEVAATPEQVPPKP
jgi:sec-independent protein translocase protein TatB